VYRRSSLLIFPKTVKSVWKTGRKATMNRQYFIHSDLWIFF